MKWIDNTGDWKVGQFMKLEGREYIVYELKDDQVGVTEVARYKKDDLDLICTWVKRDGGYEGWTELKQSI